VTRRYIDPGDTAGYGGHMSIPVDLAEVGKAAAEYDFAYLVTISDDASAHVVAVRAVVEDSVLRVAGLGRRSLANANARPQVTLVWPPRTAQQYSLISDGRATPGSAPGSITIVPSRAVKHRSAPAPTTPTDPEACVSDCVELPLHAEHA
ncbi:MAG: hypothetical protein L0H25_08950, partial [Micrococcales bacterium]|nr:hypothetical protein [Micrococcales bacterium]